MQQLAFEDRVVGRSLCTKNLELRVRESTIPDLIGGMAQPPEDFVAGNRTSVIFRPALYHLTIRHFLFLFHAHFLLLIIHVIRMLHFITYCLY